MNSLKRLRIVSICALLLLAFATLGLSEGGYPNERLYVIVEAIRPGGTCASPNPDNGAYALHGWKLAAPLTFKINRDSVPKDLNKDEAVAAIQRAASAWDDSTQASLFSYGGTTKAKAGKRDSVNAVSFGGAPFGAIAVAYVWVRDGVVLEADMSLSIGFKWAVGAQEDPSNPTDDCSGADGRMDVQDISTHEFGHWLGVAHTSDDAANNAQTMFPYASYKELFKQSLASGDKTALGLLYGP